MLNIYTTLISSYGLATMRNKDVAKLTSQRNIFFPQPLFIFINREIFLLEKKKFFCFLKVVLQ